METRNIVMGTIIILSIILFAILAIVFKDDQQKMITFSILSGMGVFIGIILVGFNLWANKPLKDD